MYVRHWWQNEWIIITATTISKKWAEEKKLLCTSFGQKEQSDLSIGFCSSQWNDEVMGMVKKWKCE